jgi:hypothetical protein
MNSTNHALHQRSATEALFDQIEQDLLALTTAPLDDRTGAPRQCVDEFADDFLSGWSMPPRRMHGGR